MIRLRLKRLLGINEMSQLEFAKLTGIRIPTVSLICNNKIKHLPLDIIDKVCSTLHCLPSDLIEYCPDEDGTEKENKE